MAQKLLSRAVDSKKSPGSNSKRVLVLTNDFPPRRGGIESFVKALSDRLVDYDGGDSIVVFTAAMPGSGAVDAKLPYPVIRDRAGTLLPTPRVRRAVVKAFKKYGCDRVLIGSSVPLGLLAPALRAAGAVRIVALTHGHEVMWVRLPVARQILQRVAGAVDYLPAITKFTRRRIGRALPRNVARAKQVLLPPGVDVDMFRPDAGSGEGRGAGVSADSTAVGVPTGGVSVTDEGRENRPLAGSSKAKEVVGSVATATSSTAGVALTTGVSTGSTAGGGTIAGGGGGAEVRASLGIPIDTPVVVCVARAMPLKGQDRLISAWPQVLEAVPDARLVLVGDGKQLDVLHRQAEHLGLGAPAAATGRSPVIFVGGVPWEDVPAYMAAGDVFVMLCRSNWLGRAEGFGIVFLEAAACGKPVIVGRSGGAPEATNDGVTGYVVNPNDLNEAAQRIIELLHNPAKAREMGARGRQFVAENYTYDTITARCATLLGL